MGPVENRRDHQPATVTAQNEPIHPSSFRLQPSKNEPIPANRAAYLIQRRAKLLRFYPHEMADAMLAEENAMKR
ncbi:MAG: hypothetical protein ACYC7E_20600 [Armatimonadota bacterium]